MKLREPTIQDEKQLLAFKAAMYENGDPLNGAAFFEEYESVAEWLANAELYTNELTVPAGFAPAHTYIYVNEQNEIIEMANLRLQLVNDFLKNFGGHIDLLPSSENKRSSELI